MDINHLNLSEAQRQTLLKIIEDTNRGGWRYPQPPASSYPKRTLNVLCNYGLIKLVSCPGYLDLKGQSVEGVEPQKREKILNFK